MVAQKQHHTKKLQRFGGAEETLDEEKFSEDEEQQAQQLVANFRKRLAQLQGTEVPSEDEASAKGSGEEGSKSQQRSHAGTQGKTPVNAARAAQPRMLAVNDAAGLERKLADIRYTPPAGMRRVPWIETLSVVAQRATEEANASDAAEKKNKQKQMLLPAANQDLEREKYFVSLTENAAREALTRLRQLRLKFSRPADFLAEMLKSDEQMTRVRERLAAEQKQQEDFEEKKRKVLNKKFNRLSGHKLVREQAEARARNEELKEIAAWRKARAARGQGPQRMLQNDSSEGAEEAFDAWVVKKDAKREEERRTAKAVQRKRMRGEGDKLGKLPANHRRRHGRRRKS